MEERAGPVELFVRLHTFARITACGGLPADRARY